MIILPIQGPSSPEEFSSWFLDIPIFVQIALIILIIAVLALTLILVFYIFKGIYLLIKGIFQGILKTSNKIAGSVDKIEGHKTQKSQITTLSNNYKVGTTNIPQFCSGCGAPVTQSMLDQLKERGIAYCALCGESMTL